MVVHLVVALIANPAVMSGAGPRDLADLAGVRGLQGQRLSLVVAEVAQEQGTNEARVLEQEKIELERVGSLINLSESEPKEGEFEGKVEYTIRPPHYVLNTPGGWVLVRLGFEYFY